MIAINPGSRRLANISGHWRTVRIICRSSHHPDYYLCEDEKTGQHYLVDQRDLHELPNAPRPRNDAT